MPDPLVSWVRREDLGTRFAELRGKRTDPARELAPLPIRAVRLDGRLEVIDGFKRLAEWADGVEVPVVVEEASLPPSKLALPGAKALLLVANAPRRTTSAMDEARVVASLADEDALSLKHVAKLLSKKDAWVETRLTLARHLAERAAVALDEGRIGVTTAHALCAFSREDQARLYAAIESHGLTTREVAALLATYRAADEAERKTLLRDPLGVLRAPQSASPLSGEPAAIAERMTRTKEALADFMRLALPRSPEPEARFLDAERRRVAFAVLSAAKTLLSEYPDLLEVIDGPETGEADPGPVPDAPLEAGGGEEARHRREEGEGRPRGPVLRPVPRSPEGEGGSFSEGGDAPHEGGGDAHEGGAAIPEADGPVLRSPEGEGGVEARAVHGGRGDEGEGRPLREPHPEGDPRPRVHRRTDARRGGSPPPARSAEVHAEGLPALRDAPW